jgi:hypothetical protein
MIIEKTISSLFSKILLQMGKGLPSLRFFVLTVSDFQSAIPIINRITFEVGSKIKK